MAFKRHPRGGLLLILFLLTGGGALYAPPEPAYAQAEKTYVIDFQGNRSLSEPELRRAAAAELEAFKREGRKRADIDDAAFQMQLAYRNAGYALATVDYQFESSDGRTRVTFRISEGPQVIVRKVRVSGNTAMDRDILVSLIANGRHARIGRTEIPFVQSRIDTAVDEIRQRYITRGYLDVVIETPRLDFSADRRKVDIHLAIREGEQYRITRIDWRGDRVAEVKKDLEGLKQALVGQPYFNRQKLILQTRMLEIFGNHGYPEAGVDIDREADTPAGEVVLTAQIDSGPRVKISAVEVQGNQHTRTRFIRKRIRLNPGDWYDLALQKESFRGLYKTGIFAKVDFQLRPTQTPGERVLLVIVEETLSKELYIEPGWGSYELLRLRVGFREKSLFGTGRIFNSEGTASIKAQSLVLRLTDRFFLDTAMRADLSTFFNRRIEPSFEREDLGASFSLNRDLAENWMGTMEYTIRKTDISNIDGEEDVAGSDENYDFASLKIQTTYDTRDDFFFPTSGQRLFASLEQAEKFIGSDVNFTRLTGGARFFFRLTPQTVLGMRYSTGWIVPGREQVLVPSAERFYNGGESTVRSFKESEIGPLNAANDPAGGLGFNTFNVEVRRRIIGNLIGSVFFDYGNVSPNRTPREEGNRPYDRRADVISDTLNDFFKGFRPGVGFGLQYLLPVGPARFDFAFNPDRDRRRNEDFFVFHFSVGMAF